MFSYNSLNQNTFCKPGNTNPLANVFKYECVLDKQGKLCLTS